MIKKLLNQFFIEKRLIGIRTKEIEWDELIIGYITDVSDQYFNINEIDEYGFPIGYTTIHIEDVCNIAYDDVYINNIQFLHENNVNFDVSKKVTLWKKFNDLIDHMEILKKSNKIIKLYFEDDIYVIGKILSFDDEFILISGIDTYGENDGFYCYYANTLEGLTYDGLEEQKIELLYNRNKHPKLG